MRVVVIDGLSGRMGRLFVERVKAAGLPCTLTAVGSNVLATSAMLKAGADAGATGENAVVVACRTAQIIVGPLGIATADAMMGEITPTMANAVAASLAYRVLIPMNLCNTYVAGVASGSAAILEDAMDHIRQLMNGGIK